LRRHKSHVIRCKMKALGPFPIGEELQFPPIGYTYKVFTYILTDERVGRGWPSEGRAVWLVPLPKPRVEYLAPFDFREMWEMKRYASEVQTKRGKWVPSKETIIEKRPVLNQLLTDVQWEDGKPRVPCHLVVRFGDGQVGVVLTDSENEMSIATTSDTFDACLDLLEDGLAANKIRWRPWGQFKKRK